MASLGSIVVFGLEAYYSSGARTRPPTLVGRWQVEFNLSGSERRLQFDADASGKGAFLLLDPRSSLVAPAEPTKARWNQTASNQVSFSGDVEFPIGNVGRLAGTLTFNGAFKSSDSISGRVTFVSSGEGAKQTGTFRARRIRPPRLSTGQRYIIIPTRCLNIIAGKN